jgi:hypothetical protein
MRMIYLKVNKNGIVRKIAVDMASLASHKNIRLPKYYFEEGLYLSYKKNINESSIDEYHLTKDKIKKEDSDFYYFDFPFKIEQVYGIAV